MCWYNLVFPGCSWGKMLVQTGCKSTGSSSSYQTRQQHRQLEKRLCETWPVWTHKTKFTLKNKCLNFLQVRSFQLPASIQATDTFPTNQSWSSTHSSLVVLWLFWTEWSIMFVRSKAKHFLSQQKYLHIFKYIKGYKELEGNMTRLY